MLPKDNTLVREIPHTTVKAVVHSNYFTRLVYCLEHKSNNCDCVIDRNDCCLKDHIYFTHSSITAFDNATVYSVVGRKVAKTKKGGFVLYPHSIKLRIRDTGKATVIVDGKVFFSLSKDYLKILSKYIPEVPFKNSEEFYMYRNPALKDILPMIANMTENSLSCELFFNRYTPSQRSTMYRKYCKGGIKAVASNFTGVSHKQLNKLSWLYPNYDYRSMLKHHSADSLIHHMNQLPGYTDRFLGLLEETLSVGFKLSLPLVSKFSRGDTYFGISRFLNEIYKPLKRMVPEYQYPTDVAVFSHRFISLVTRDYILAQPTADDVYNIPVDHSDTVDGVVITSIKTQRDLAMKSVVLQNCICSYMWEVYYAKAVLYVATKGDDVVACIELRDNKLVQASGVGNSRIDPEVSIAIQEWIAIQGIELRTDLDFDGLPF